jgi:hypothetical protein
MFVAAGGLLWFILFFQEKLRHAIFVGPIQPGQQSNMVSAVLSGARGLKRRPLAPHPHPRFRLLHFVGAVSLGLICPECQL